MAMFDLKNLLETNSYPGRGIVIGKSADGKNAMIAYFIMGRSENSRNRIFEAFDGGMRTKAFDESKLSDPSLIIYNPYRAIGDNDIITNGDQTDTVYEAMMMFVLLVKNTIEINNQLKAKNEAPAAEEVTEA